MSILSITTNLSTVSNCVFDQCSSISGNICHLDCNNCSFHGNRIENCHTELASPMYLSMSEGVTRFAHDHFHVDVGSEISHPMMTLKSINNTEIQFFNCCFTHSVTAETTQYHAPMYLTFTGAGTVSFSQVCFDTSKDKAISSEVPISCETAEEDYFGDKCLCWANDEPSKGANIGLIVGIVVGVLVVIAVVVVVVVILLRKKQKEQHSTSKYHEVSNEETVTSISDELTSNSSRDGGENPLFMTKEPMSTFAHHFEEALNY